MAQPAHSKLTLLMAICAAITLPSLAFSASAQAAGDTAQAWGANGFGQLGNGTTSMTGCACIDSPAPVSGVSGASAIGAGSDFGLALLTDGTVSAWGNNSRGQVGNGTTTTTGCDCIDSPVGVSGLTGASAIAAGADHSLALLSNGTVMAWGRNNHGQLGNGTVSGSGCGCIDSPAPVSGLSGVVAIAGGASHSLALLSNGTLMAWGSNFYGELGNGTTTSTGCNCIASPAPVSGLSGVVAIAAGANFSLALLSDGTVRAWGDNFDGELGNGTTTTTGCDCVVTPAPVSGLSGATAIAGRSSFGLALLSDGTARGWGDNTYGELDNPPTNTPQTTPVAVGGLAAATAISAGVNQSLALLSDRTARGWGANDEGQLGNGTTTTTGCFCIASPVPVNGLSDATAIAAGGNHGLALAGPSQKLSVSLAGAATGVVGGSGILCPTTCSHDYPQGAVAILIALPAAGSGFAGFSGACTGTGSCQAGMGQDQSVTATFGPPKGTKITKAKINKRKRQARFSFTAPGAITGFKCELVKPRRKHHKKPKARFRKCSSPRTYKHLRAGKYTFKVAALDILGADATPAHKKFKIRP